MAIPRVTRDIPIQIEEELPEAFRIPPSDIRIGKQIGSGGFSTVHKAFWRGQPCAAKVVQTTDVRAIQKEVAILSKLDHPHVIRCIGFSVDSIEDPSGRCMILMDLMDGDLRHVMNKRLANKLFRRKVPFSEAQAVNILEQIAAGMEYLHEQRVFHGDLKASNILVSSHGPHMHVKITDFGVSMMVKRDPSKDSEEFARTKHFRGEVGTRGYQAPEVSSSSHSSNGHVGTAYYRAPEVSTWRSNDFYTAKADTYCFAMTCYEILSGRVPFDDVRKPDIPELVMRGERPVLPENVDQRLIELIEQCWHRKPLKRPGFGEIRSWLVDYSVAAVRKERKVNKIFTRVLHFPCIIDASSRHRPSNGLLSLQRPSNCEITLQRKADIMSEGVLPGGRYPRTVMAQFRLASIRQTELCVRFLHKGGATDGAQDGADSAEDIIQNEAWDYKYEDEAEDEVQYEAMKPKVEPMSMKPKVEPMSMKPKVEHMSMKPKVEPMSMKPKMERIYSRRWAEREM